MKAVAVPYVIALVLGIVVIGLFGYWFLAQGNKTVSVGSAVDCATVRFNYCNGFTNNWDDKCGTPKPNREPKDQCLNTPVPTTTSSASQECRPGDTSGSGCPSAEVKTCSSSGRWGGCAP